MEACIENHTKSNLYMDQVEFEPAQHWSATVLKADEHTTSVTSQMRWLARSFGHYILVLLYYCSSDNAPF